MRRLTILLAVVGGLLLIPAAAQANTGVEHLTVNITGSGAGLVFGTEGNPYEGSPRLDCSYNGTSKSGTCKTLMNNEGEGYEAVLAHAVAAPGSKFVKWTIQHGEVEGCGTFTGCLPYVEPEETGEDNSEITAIFDAEPGPSLFRVLKTGEGTVVSNPPGIFCGTTCETTFEEGKIVTLTASPAAGWAFGAWGYGCLEHVGLTCTVLMDKARDVKVTFVATPSLTVEKAGSGYGKVVAMGISCDESCSKATSGVKTGTSVTVKTTPAKGSEPAVLEGGAGSASGCSGAACTFTISANSSVKVKFDPKPIKSLTVNLTGPGAYKGKVTGKGIAKGLYGSTINCGAGCTTQTESFFAIDTVTLTATAASGYTFAGWSGSGCSGTGTCTVATSSDKTVEAEFE